MAEDHEVNELAEKLRRRSDINEGKAAPEVAPKPAAAAAAGAEGGGDSEENELTAKLKRRTDINAGQAAPAVKQRFNAATEFPEFSFKELRQYEAMFRKVWMGGEEELRCRVHVCACFGLDKRERHERATVAHLTDCKKEC
jgi:hypothetical protein